jgi:hypothetical protein
LLSSLGVGLGQVVERVERVQATAAAHPALTSEQLFRREPEDGLATWAASEHQERTMALQIIE